jgi:hypothetical protein
MRPSAGLLVLAAHYPIKIHLFDAPEEGAIAPSSTLKVKIKGNNAPERKV